MSSFRRLIVYLRPYRAPMLAAALLVMAVAVINLSMLWVLRGIVDTVLVQRNPHALNKAVIDLALLFLLQGLCGMGHSYLTASIGQRVVVDIRSQIVRHLQRLSLSFFARRRTGELISRVMNDVGLLQRTLTDAPIDFAKQIVTLAGGVTILFIMNWRLCLLILLMLPAIVLVARLFGRRLKELSTVIQDETANASTILEEIISAIRVVKSFVRESYEQARFDGQLRRSLLVALRRAAVLSVFVPIITFVTFAGAAGVLWYGGNQVIHGMMTAGDLIAFVLYGGLLIGPFGGFARLFSEVKESQGAAARAFEILDTKPDLADLPSARALPLVRGEVSMNHVGFAYDPRVPVLKDISFTAHPGEVVAIVGPTGSGKTTLINLLHRFYDPLTGCVMIDGHDLRTVTLASLYPQIGLVPQETHLFGGTIRENILYGRPRPYDRHMSGPADEAQEHGPDGRNGIRLSPESDVLAAARAANAHEFIASFPEGYETMVGEKGVNLSGGQRQCIAIARAVLKNPRILILDEATSALDNESELLVQEALDRLMQGRTTFVIAHRLSTIQKADRILVLDNGKIIEEGTHVSLLEKGGLYYHLYTLRLGESSPST